MLHVLVHDLREAHGAADHLEIDGAGHGDHEHPVLSSVQTSAPLRTRFLLPAVAHVAPRVGTWNAIARLQRNVIAFGSLRLDDDVGLQILLSTLLI